MTRAALALALLMLAACAHHAAKTEPLTDSSGRPLTDSLGGVLLGQPLLDPATGRQLLDPKTGARLRNPVVTPAKDPQ